MRQPQFGSRCLPWMIVALVAGLGGALYGQDTPASNLESQLRGVLTEQTRAWNAGDLEAFMQTYWKSERLSFSSGGNTTYGWQATLDRYRRGYAPPKEMGQLRFDKLEVTPLGDRAALVLGHWHLTMSDQSVREGNFSLVLRKIEGQWKIIHDHSSLREPEEAP